MAGYGSDAEFTTWLSDNGHELPVGAPTLAVLRQRGSVYVDGYERRFLGLPTGGPDQERSWPRTGVPGLASDVVPRRVIHASYEAALQEAREPGSLSVVGSAAGIVKREKVEGAVEVEYQAGSGDAAVTLMPVMTAVEGLLAPFLLPVTPGFGLWSIGCG